MRKLLFLFSGLLLAAQAFSQTQVRLINYSLIKGYGTSGNAIAIKPIFEHDGSTLAADSAIYDQAANVFDALAMWSSPSLRVPSSIPIF